MVASIPGQTIGISVFTDYLILNLPLDRLEISLAYMLGTLLGSFSISRIGKLTDRIGTRPVSVLASVVLGCTLLYLSHVDYLAGIVTSILPLDWDIPAAFITLVLGFYTLRFFGQGVLTLASRTMLMRWFFDLRGRINSISGAVVALIFSGAPLFFDQLIREFGWRGAWIVLGINIGFLFSIFAALFYRENPESCGLLPDGRPHEDEKGITIFKEDEWTLFQAKRSYTFWIFNLSLSIFTLLFTALTFHIVSIFETAQLSRTDALAIFLPSSVFAVLINLTSGWILDSKTFKSRLKFLFIVMLVSFVITCSGTLLLKHSYGMMMIIVGMGFSSGLYVSLVGVCWPKYFGRKHLGEISGYNMAFMVFTSAIGPPLFGLPFTYFGGYSLAIWFCLIASLIMIILSFKADKPDISNFGYNEIT